MLGTIDADDRQLVARRHPGADRGRARTAPGSGHDFLAHVERTRLLVHVLDLAPLDGSDPVRNFEVIERELAEHDPRLASLPRLLALSKADLVPPEVAAAAAAEWRARVAFPVLVTSSATGSGWPSCAASCSSACRWPTPAPEGAGEDEVAEFAVFRPAAARAFEITRGPAGEWIVTGEPSSGCSCAGTSRTRRRRRTSSGGCSGWA